jgi:hypothetical protein
MRPHPDDLDDTLAAKHLIDETMLNVDPARERADEIADEFLKGRGRLERIAAEDFEQRFGFGLETGSFQLLRIFRRLRSSSL